MNKQSDAFRWAAILEHQAKYDGATDYKHKAAAELRRLHEENKRLRLDAERYQWLKQRWTTTLLDGSIQMANSHGIRCKSFSEIDAVIDASRANYEY